MEYAPEALASRRKCKFHALKAFQGHRNWKLVRNLCKNVATNHKTEISHNLGSDTHPPLSEPVPVSGTQPYKCTGQYFIQNRTHTSPPKASGLFAFVCKRLYGPTAGSLGTAIPTSRRRISGWTIPSWWLSDRLTIDVTYIGLLRRCS